MVAPLKRTRFDPYRNFKFRVKWDGRYVAGVTKISPLKRTTDVIEHRDGSDPNTTRKLPGRTTYAPIVLERGITHDPEFENWANMVVQAAAGGGSAQQAYRKDVRIELYDLAGRLTAAYTIYRCWVSEFQALPDLDSTSNGVLVQSIRLEHEGFERDPTVPQAAPAEQEPG